MTSIELQAQIDRAKEEIEGLGPARTEHQEALNALVRSDDFSGSQPERTRLRLAIADLEDREAYLRERLSHLEPQHRRAMDQERMDALVAQLLSLRESRDEMWCSFFGMVGSLETVARALATVRQAHTQVGHEIADLARASDIPSGVPEPADPFVAQSPLAYAICMAAGALAAVPGWDVDWRHVNDARAALDARSARLDAEPALT